MRDQPPISFGFDPPFFPLQAHNRQIEWQLHNVLTKKHLLSKGGISIFFHHRIEAVLAWVCVCVCVWKSIGESKKH